MFVIAIRDGATAATAGEPPGGLVADFASTAREAGLMNGTIYVIGSRNGPTLDFSSDVPTNYISAFGTYWASIATASRRRGDEAG